MSESTMIYFVYKTDKKLVPLGAIYDHFGASYGYTNWVNMVKDILGELDKPRPDLVGVWLRRFIQLYGIKRDIDYNYKLTYYWLPVILSNEAYDYTPIVIDVLNSKLIDNQAEAIKIERLFLKTSDAINISTDENEIFYTSNIFNNTI